MYCFFCLPWIMTGACRGPTLWRSWCQATGRGSRSSGGSPASRSHNLRSISTSNTWCSRANSFANLRRYPCRSAQASVGNKSERLGLAATSMISVTTSWNPFDPVWCRRGWWGRKGEYRAAGDKIQGRGERATRPASTALPCSASVRTWPTSSSTPSGGVGAGARQGGAARTALALSCHDLSEGAPACAESGQPGHGVVGVWSPTACGTNRLAKTASCFCRSSRATSGEEITTVVTAPRRSDMSGVAGRRGLGGGCRLTAVGGGGAPASVGIQLEGQRFSNLPWASHDVTYLLHPFFQSLV